MGIGESGRCWASQSGGSRNCVFQENEGSPELPVFSWPRVSQLGGVVYPFAYVFVLVSRSFLLGVRCHRWIGSKWFNGVRMMAWPTKLTAGRWNGSNFVIQRPSRLCLCQTGQREASLWFLFVYEYPMLGRGSEGGRSIIVAMLPTVCKGPICCPLFMSLVFVGFIPEMLLLTFKTLIMMRACTRLH